MKFTPFRLTLILGALVCLFPFINASVALLLGIVLAIIFRNREKENFQGHSGTILKTSIVLIGFGMNLDTALSTSTFGLGLTFFTVSLTILFGLLIGKTLKMNKNTTILIAAGTAICGGSAIAAISPVIQAKSQQMSFALVVVFLLNAIALLMFPLIGEFLQMNEELFGRWAGVAIHDTSSVVGAASAYGSEALEVATTIKLTRTLWIIPVTLLLSYFHKEGKVKPRVPWFIVFFVLAMVMVYLFPRWSDLYQLLNTIGRRGLVIALFLIGSTFNASGIRQAGVRPFVLGILLWILIGVSSLVVLGTI